MELSSDIVDNKQRQNHTEELHMSLKNSYHSIVLKQTKVLQICLGIILFPFLLPPVASVGRAIGTSLSLWSLVQVHRED